MYEIISNYSRKGHDILYFGNQPNDESINHNKGMQLILYQHIKRSPENKLQISHYRNNHWITVSFFSSVDSILDDLYIWL